MISLTYIPLWLILGLNHFESREAESLSILSDFFMFFFSLKKQTYMYIKCIFKQLYSMIKNSCYSSPFLFDINLRFSSVNAPTIPILKITSLGIGVISKLLHGWCFSPKLRSLHSLVSL